MFCCFLFNDFGRFHSGISNFCRSRPPQERTVFSRYKLTGTNAAYQPLLTDYFVNFLFKIRRWYAYCMYWDHRHAVDYSDDVVCSWLPWQLVAGCWCCCWWWWWRQWRSYLPTVSTRRFDIKFTYHNFWNFAAWCTVKGYDNPSTNLTENWRLTLKIWKCKTVQNLARFRTTWNFDRKYMYIRIESKYRQA